MFNERQTEVVIVGAGIAGLTAAKFLEKYNVQFQLLEASHRVGGRAYSEKLSNNNWFDLGCSYLHNGDLNPFVSIANKMNFPIDTLNGDMFDSHKTHYVLDGKKINLGSPNPFDIANENILDKIKRSQTDAALLEAIDIKDPFFPITCHLYANLNAADPDVMSSEDYKASLYEGPDYPVSEGFGNLIKKWAKNIRVNLNTKVSQINSEGPLVKIKTSKGTLVTKKVILTVSTGVLAGHDIEMIPCLPKKTVNAINNLPMGTLNKIGISFNEQFFSQKDQGWYVSWASGNNITDHQIGSFQVNTSGPQNVVVFAGGRYGKWLEDRGSKAMLDYAISMLEDVFGKNCTQKIENSITTAWASEPLTKGSYSYATPGKKSSRLKLAQPIENKIYIAGEATEINHYGTAHGAYFSGIKVATKVLGNL